MMNKKMLAIMLTGAMVLGTGATSLAANDTTGSTTGAGDFEGHVEKSVTEVSLPTDDGSTFKYILDPELLIKATDAAKYEGCTFEGNSGVYFQTGDSSYAADSKKLKVTNKGSEDVDVTLKAKVDSSSTVTMVDNSAVTTGTDKNLYLGLKVAEGDAKAATKKITSTESDSTISVGLKGKADNFETTYTPGADGAAGSYGYTIKEGTPDTAWNYFEFGLTGAANTNATWEASDTAPTVTVTWSYAKRAADSTADMLTENAKSEAAPSIATTTYQMTENQPVVITGVDLGIGDLAATGITSAVWPGDGKDYLGNTITYDEDAGTITMASGTVNYFLKQTEDQIIKITFNDTASTCVDITFTK